ncbi:uncharacterized protein LOC110013547 isoform X3 [Oryzias latipes]|uniref:uncharacterized protein LOC110013547 isoform X3 n=1 Tax=Oryzias latipes TaxID=8090 RepID=UPI000CE231FE|nr:uncharacterized protein LOC110013547 isoform X3 [Oryzias latipes]
MTRDVREYIAACTTCARSKTSHSPPSGLLHPLPTPSRPWSHIAVDFVTGLPPSHGHSIIFTVIDRFSKFVHFIPLPQLPTATETADILVHHVFRHHGIPSDIVSDRGPQFCSQVWKAFCSALGVSPFEASLGFPPPLFPSHELDLAVPSIQEHLQRCQRVWQQTRAALLRTKESNCQTANRHRVVGPSYQPGQRPLSRSTRPSTSPRSSRSLTAVYARLPLPRHPPGSSMALRRTPLAASWTSGAGVAAISSWSIGRGMVLRNAPGSPVRSFWTPPLSPTSTVPTRIVVLDRLEAVVRGGGTVMAPLSSPPLCSAPDSTSCDQFTLINSALLKETQLHNSSPDRYPLWIPARQCHLCGSQFEPPCCSGNTTLC